MQVKQLLTRTAGAMGVTAGLLFVGSPLMAQVKIGDNPNSINSSSILELESASKALLLPRVPLQARGTKAPVINAVAGMHVYNTTDNDELEPGEYYFTGTEWERIVTEIPEDRYIYADGPATGACTDGKIWVNILDGSPTEGQQWICRNGVWDPYNAPASTPFYQGYTKKDAGSAKGGLISRTGHIVSQRLAADKTTVIGRSTVTPGGILQLFRSTDIDPAYSASVDFTNAINNSPKYRVGIRNDVAGGALVFHTTATAGGTPVPRMMLTSNGKLGLGITDVVDANDFHIKGTIQGSAQGTGPVALGLGTATTSGYRFYYQDVDANNVPVNKAQIVVQSGDNFANLVLTKRTLPDPEADPFVVFRVNGAEQGKIIRNANGQVGFEVTTSDRRLKENIKSTHYSIDDLMKIGVMEYNYKVNPKKERTIGFIAQDLYKVFPEAVVVGGEDEKTNPWRVDYNVVTPLLVKAVQDQQKEIAALKAQLGEMNALKAEVASIKAMLGNAEQKSSEATISK